MSWQKETPKESGLYWAAARNGELAGPFNVVWNDGALIMAGQSPYSQWKGWWWSEPVPPPAKPPPWGDSNA